MGVGIEYSRPTDIAAELAVPKQQQEVSSGQPVKHQRAGDETIAEFCGMHAHAIR